jgi:hypothetical protein
MSPPLCVDAGVCRPAPRGSQATCGRPVLSRYRPGPRGRLPCPAPCTPPPSCPSPASRQTCLARWRRPWSWRGRRTRDTRASWRPSWLAPRGLLLVSGEAGRGRAPWGFASTPGRRLRRLSLQPNDHRRSGGLAAAAAAAAAAGAGAPSDPAVVPPRAPRRDSGASGPFVLPPPFSRLPPPTTDHPSICVRRLLVCM